MNNTVSISSSKAIPFIKETLASGDTIRLTVTGHSMEPTFIHNTTIVTIIPLHKEPHKKDVVLALCKDKLVLHRISKLHPLTLQGDHQLQTEIIDPSQILGIVESYQTNNKTYTKRPFLTTINVKHHQLFLRTKRLIKKVVKR